MRILRLPMLAALLMHSTVDAQSPPATGDTPPSTPREQALDQMLTERDSLEKLEKAIKHASELGISDQVALEARFLFHVDRQEDGAIASLLPQFLDRSDKFRLAESEIFAVEEDWLAVIEYVQAIAALEKNDKAGFKKHITEAFWLSPRQGAAFAPHIDRVRMKEAMSQVAIDFAIELPDLDGKLVSLQSLISDKKALLLHFWSPWSHECEASMPDFQAAAVEFIKNDIAVASILGEAGPEVITDAKNLLKNTSDKPPGAWLVDQSKPPLHQQLRVQSVPVMILITPDGKVAFNGHPSDPELWNELNHISPSIERPRVDQAEP